MTCRVEIPKAEASIRKCKKPVSKTLRQEFDHLPQEIREWQNQILDGVQHEDTRWSKAVTRITDIFGSKGSQEFCTMCWKQRVALDPDNKIPNITFFIGPDKLSRKGKDKILIECRIKAKTTKESKEAAQYFETINIGKTVKTVFEMRKEGRKSEKVFIRSLYGVHLFTNIEYGKEQ